MLSVKAYSKLATVSKPEHPVAKSLVLEFPWCTWQQSCSAHLCVQLTDAVFGCELLPLLCQWRMKPYFCLGSTINYTDPTATPLSSTFWYYLVPFHCQNTWFSPFCCSLTPYIPFCLWCMFNHSLRDKEQTFRTDRLLKNQLNSGFLVSDDKVPKLTYW